MKDIGKVCYIITKDSFYYGEWGVIKHFDGENYHIAIRNGTDSLPIFTRNEIRIPRKEQQQRLSKLFGTFQRDNYERG